MWIPQTTLNEKVSRMDKRLPGFTAEASLAAILLRRGGPAGTSKEEGVLVPAYWCCAIPNVPYPVPVGWDFWTSAIWCFFSGGYLFLC